jgi:hypothetical protein
MRGGVALATPPSVAAIRDQARAQLASLPQPLLALAPAAPYPVGISDNLRELARQVDDRQTGHAQEDRARWEQDAE